VDVTESYEGTDFYCDVAIPHPDQLAVVHESAQVLAYHHTRPSWEVHVVVVPKRHIPSLTSLVESDEPLVRELLSAIQVVARTLERSHGAARVITNLGAYQDSKHFHVHIVSGTRLEPPPN